MCYHALSFLQFIIVNVITLCKCQRIIIVNITFWNMLIQHFINITQCSLVEQQALKSHYYIS